MDVQSHSRNVVVGLKGSNRDRCIQNIATKTNSTDAARFRDTIVHSNENFRFMYHNSDSRIDSHLCHNGLCDTWTVTILRLFDMDDRELFIFCHHKETFMILIILFYFFVLCWALTQLTMARNGLSFKGNIILQDVAENTGARHY